MLQDELRMISGVCTDDMDYIGYLLLKGGSYFKKPEIVKVEEPVYPTDAVPGLEQWFNNL